MATPKVWSEQGGAHRLATHSVTDCTYSANLMVLVHAGFRNFPKGAFTAEERNTLESSDAEPDHIGANHAITDVAIGNSRVKNKQNTRMQLPVLFLRKLHHLVVLSDIHEAHRRRDLCCCWRYPHWAGQEPRKAMTYMLQAKVVPFMMDYKLISPLPASGWRRTR